MRNTFVALAFVAFALTSCGVNDTKVEDKTQNAQEKMDDMTDDMMDSMDQAGDSIDAAADSVTIKMDDATDMNTENQ